MKLYLFTKAVVLAMALTSCGTKKETITPSIDLFANKKGAIVESKNFTANELKSAPLINNENMEWHHLDLNLDKTYGVSDDLAYKTFKLQQKNEVIVAVIDSGVDIYHEDLKDVIWINKNEIPNNGIDDDGNGYIDDINGWNFIGGKDGRNIEGETLEVTRLYSKLSKKKQSGTILSEDEIILLATTKRIVKEELAHAKKIISMINKDLLLVKKYTAVLTKKIGIKEITIKKQLTDIQTGDQELQDHVEALLKLWNKYQSGFPGMHSTLSNYNHAINVYYNVDYDARKEIVGDDPSDFTDKKYGNNDVKGGDSSHGTHVAGIIAASRNNNIGYNGIAANVKIMSLRAVPNGDERDKDIVFAVRYAVDNGAKIINMSFGKSFSPYKEEVDKAFQYAASKGVLLVHAAGNEGKNINLGYNNYPNNYLLDGGVLTKNRISNWIEVGASYKNLGLDLVASFSNHGNDAVTLFAPGKKIMSTTPENHYAAYSGTSMACPVTAGVASLLMSEFPTMTGDEAQKILIHSVSTPAGLRVRSPSEARLGDPDFRIPVPFSTLSQTGGVLNAFDALKLAFELAEIE